MFDHLPFIDGNKLVSFWKNINDLYVEENTKPPVESENPVLLLMDAFFVCSTMQIHLSKLIKRG